MRVRSRLCLAVADTRSGHLGEYSSLYYGGILHSFFGIWLRMRPFVRDLDRGELQNGLQTTPPGRPETPATPRHSRVTPDQ